MQRERRLSTQKIDTAIGSARQASRDADYVLSAECVEALNLLLDAASCTDGARLHTPEFGRDEYLVNCDAAGCPTNVESCADLDALTVGNEPWIKRAGEHLLVSRWLAHFIGFRHRVIHLFLDHPDHPDCTFAQIRSLAKYNSPGRLDMPIGGHVTDSDDLPSSLTRELHEELGLEMDRDVDDLREVGTFNVLEDADMPDHIEVELATVYRATIKRELVSKLRFQPGEVGALALFRIDELDRWIRERPEDVGGGMRDSWRYYKKRH